MLTEIEQPPNGIFGGVLWLADSFWWNFWWNCIDGQARTGRRLFKNVSIFYIFFYSNIFPDGQHC